MFKTEYRISFSDCDPAGIIFFANLFRIAHIAYEELMNDIGSSEVFFPVSNFLLPIIHSEADFINPIQYDQLIRIDVEVSKLKRSSFELEYKISDGRGKKLGLIKTVHVAVEKPNFKKTELPEEFIAKLDPHVRR
jgi:1,4-dihydroxy-2-naphthoyl-CoA hydrolase